MRAWLRGLLALAVVGVGAPPGSGQEPSRAEVIKRVKAATAYVQARPRGEGSAFCVDRSGFFLTNEHVVRKATEVTLVLNSGLADQEVVTAKVIRSDADLDLALLKVDGKVTCSPLPLGSSDGLLEQTEVIAAGFPFGKDLALEKGEYPSVSINSGKITSLRMKKGELRRIQLDVVLNPGNSGGPVVDGKGKVIGVVVSGVKAATVNFAIPVHHVYRFVGTPEIEFRAPTVAYADRFKPVAFQIKTLSILPAREPYQVELLLTVSGGAEHSVPMKLDRDVYRAVTEPLRRPKGSAMLRITLTYPKGSLSGLVPDRPLKVGGEEINLAAVRSVRFGAEPVVVLLKDRVVKGRLSGLDDLALQLGTDTVKLDPNRAVELAVAPPDPDDHVTCTVVVRGGGKELARVREVLAFRNAPVAVAPAKGPAEAAGGPQKLDGFWVVESTESRGTRAWPQSPEEALYIEQNKVTWVRKNGLLPPNPFEADLEVVSGKNPHRLTLSIRRGPARDQKWQVIYKIEGNLLTLATDCDEDRCPSLFTVRAVPGGALFVRTYRRMSE